MADSASTLELPPPESETGILMAYAALLFMAIVPIYLGARRSVVVHSKRENLEDLEVMTSKDAYMFPLYASGALFGLYLLFKLVGKEYVNLILGAYFFVLGVLSVTTTLRPLSLLLCPKFFTEYVYKGSLVKEPAHQEKPASQPTTPASASEAAPAEGSPKPAKPIVERIWDLSFDKVDLVSLVLASILGAWYLYEKHWIANNIFALSFSISGVTLIPLGSFQVGCTLLAGLFLYDIFWVFGTDVMVTVAKSFDAPIKVLFPKDFLLHGLGAKQFAMLGLGDIVIPGILIALLLRFDSSSKRSGAPYFHATYVAYIAGLVLTIVVMHWFKAAQPALLYLVPACLLTPILLSLIRGEVKELWTYSDEDEKKESSKEQ